MYDMILLDYIKLIRKSTKTKYTYTDKAQVEV